jgi:putative FmdB family regulatory protein
MPTYEYACGACGHQWEVVQRITEAPVVVCPACSQNEAHRQISKGTNFILKGGGWYSDLYASPKEPAKDTDKDKDKAAAPAATETKTETKAETKAETKTETKTASTATETSAAPSRPTPPAASS